MQAENETYSDFLGRTDRLAYQKGARVEDLQGVLGISRASLFGYRSGKRKVPAKVWMKLGDEEKKVGLPDLVRREMLPNEIPKPPGGPDDEKPPDCPSDLEGRMMWLETRFAGMMAAVERMARAWEKVAEALESKVRHGRDRD